MAKKKAKHDCELLPYEITDVLTAQEAKQQAGWQVVNFDLKDVWKYSTGKGVKVAVVDTGCDLLHPDLKDNLIEGVNFVNEKKSPQDDNGHGCVDPDTLIYTNLFGIESIQSLYDRLDYAVIFQPHQNGVYLSKDVRHLGLKTYSVLDSGDTIISNVCFIHRINISENVYKIDLYDGTEFKLTSWHPVYIFDDNFKIIRKRAENLIVGDRFVFPVHGDIGSIGKRNSVKISDNVVIDESTAYLIGLVMTRGVLSGGLITVYCPSDIVVQKVLDICEQFGLIVEINCNKATLKSTKFIELLRKLGLINPNNHLVKTVPSCISVSPLSIIQAFIVGVIDGCGFGLADILSYKLFSKSKKFIAEIRMLLSSVGMLSSYHQEKRDKSLLHCCDIFKQSTDMNLNDSSLNKVKSIDVVQYDGYFYDFTMMQDHNNYLANGYYMSNTHVSGIIAAQNNNIGMVGIAPDAKIMPIKVLDKNGNGKMDNVAKGVKWAVEHDADIITMSLGCPNPLQQVRKAIQYAVKKDVFIFCAAGNSGNSSDVYFPARYPEVICVGALNEDLDIAPFSNVGKSIDFLAPGVSIFSTSINHWYCILSGTSQAVPFMAGMYANFLSFVSINGINIKNNKPTEFKRLFSRFVVPLSYPGFHKDFGIMSTKKFITWLSHQHDHRV